jgi:hypothetical protein
LAVGVVDAAAVQAVGVGVVGMELDAQAGLEERARHPRGRKAEEAAGAGQFGLNLGLGVLLDGLELRDGVHGNAR